MEDIYDYVLEEFGESVAERVFDDLHKAFRALAERPGMGRARPELAPEPWFIWTVGPSLVAYRPDTQPIQVARIVRAERNWENVEL